MLDLQIRCILQYTVIDETITRQADLRKNRSKTFNLPGLAVNICLNILNCSLPETKLIYHDCISGNENICYEIRGTAQNPICIKTSC